MLGNSPAASILFFLFLWGEVSCNLLNVFTKLMHVDVCGYSGGLIPKAGLLRVSLTLNILWAKQLYFVSLLSYLRECRDGELGEAFLWSWTRFLCLLNQLWGENRRKEWQSLRCCVPNRWSKLYILEPLNKKPVVSNQRFCKSLSELIRH